MNKNQESLKTESLRTLKKTENAENSQRSQSNSEPSVMQKIYSETTHPFSVLTSQIIKLAIKVHRAIGPGFKEKYYQRALYLELKSAGIPFKREVKATLRYNNAVIGYHQLDFVVSSKVVVEIKSVKELSDIDVAQLASYLKSSNYKLGLLLNFGQSKLEIKRVIK